MKPNCCRMPTTSRPDNLRRLGMSRIGLEGDEERRMITKSEHRGGLTFQMKTDRFAEVGDRVVQRAALGDNGNFDAFRHITGLVTRPDRRSNSLLQVGHVYAVLNFHRSCKTEQSVAWDSSSERNWSRGHWMYASSRSSSCGLKQIRIGDDADTNSHRRLCPRLSCAEIHFCNRRCGSGHAPQRQLSKSLASSTGRSSCERSP